MAGRPKRRARLAAEAAAKEAAQQEGPVEPAKASKRKKAEARAALEAASTLPPDAAGRKSKTDELAAAIFTAHYAATGSAARAAEAAGWNHQTGRQFLRRNPQVEEALRAMVLDAGAEAAVTWQEGHQKAIRRIIELIDDHDGRVALEAAKTVVDRVEGKVMQSVQVEDSSGLSLASATMRFVASVHLAKGLSIAEAMAYAREHPQEVEQWARMQDLPLAQEVRQIPPGRS